MKEKDFQKQVIQLAEILGWVVYHFSDSRRQVSPGVFVGDSGCAGFPDLVLVRDRVVFAELKGNGGRLRPKQVEAIDSLRNARAEVYVWFPNDLVGIQRVLK